MYSLQCTLSTCNLLYLAHQEQYRQLQGQYRQLQQQFSRYSGSKHYDPEKIQQLKGRIEEVKGRIQHLQKIQRNDLCPPDAIDKFSNCCYPLLRLDFTVA